MLKYAYNAELVGEKKRTTTERISMYFNHDAFEIAGLTK